MTDRERELASLGFEYAEGIERANVVTLPASGREVRRFEKTDGTPYWEVQPYNDNTWLEFDNIIDAIKCGTRPKS